MKILNEKDYELLNLCLELGVAKWLGNSPNWKLVGERLGYTNNKVRKQYNRIVERVEKANTTINSVLSNYNNQVYNTTTWEPPQETNVVYEEINQKDPIEVLIDASGIDRNKFDIYPRRVWGSPGSLQASFGTSPKTPKLEDFTSLIEKLGDYSPKLNRINHPKGEHVAKFSLYDAHIGKRGVNGESTTELVRDYTHAVNDLVNQVSIFDLNEVTYVIGQDDLHYDNVSQTTTRLTPQDTDVSWRTGIDIMCELAIKSILTLRELAPVKVIVVPGNHNRYSAYWAGIFVDGYFKDDPLVNIDNSHNLRKYYKFGDNGFLLQHGDIKLKGKMAQIFAVEAPLIFGSCKNLEIWEGHYHHQKKYVEVINEDRGVIYRTMPSLSFTDQWHQNNLYNFSNRTAIATVFHKTKLQRGEFLSNVV